METLGDFAILKSLGEGPFGASFLAEHRFLKKKFVLKVLPPTLLEEDPSFSRRFEEKVALLASLDHPHIAKVHTVSSVEGHYFLVTDPFVDGQAESFSLARFLQGKKEALSEEEKKSLLEQIVDAVDFAHGQGVVHGGLKPSNIFITLREGEIFVLVADFGIGALLGEGIFFSRWSQAIGAAFSRGEKGRWPISSCLFDFACLSPEQKEGSLPTEKSDIFALGVLGYKIATGKLPEGKFPSLASLHPSYSGKWDLFFDKTLSYEVEKRGKSARSLFLECFSLLPPTSFVDVEAKVEPLLQMSFAFAAKKEEPQPVLQSSEIKRPEYEEDPGAIFQKELLVSQYTPKKMESEDEIDPLPSEMVVIPGGSYWRGGNEGARDEMPRHQIHIRSFALDIHPVTNEQFLRFLQAMGGEKDHNNNDIIRLRDSRIKRTAGKVTVESGYAKHPVVGVTWYGAVAYAKWVGKRLPYEAEWEVAASSGKENFLYPTGAEIDRTEANFFSSDTTPILSYPPNSLGVYDMAGNVYEWCQDWYAYNYYDLSAIEPTYPTGPQQGVYRVLRGGCWKSLKEDLRCAHRHRNNPGAVNGAYGFRCAADVA